MKGDFNRYIAQFAKENLKKQLVDSGLKVMIKLLKEHLNWKY